MGLPQSDSLTLAEVVAKQLILISSGAYLHQYIDAALEGVDMPLLAGHFL
ncbi:hypothetical protein ACSSV8_003686 [Roseovarius sp. MBR-79]|jgi:hypothetical protein